MAPGAGRLLSAPRIIAEVQEKQQLGQDCGAAAVDMESACAAAFCLERGLPFVSIRVISDEVRTRLSPRLAALLNGSEVRLPRVLAALARAPWLLPELWRARPALPAGRRSAWPTPWWAVCPGRVPCCRPTPGLPYRCATRITRRRHEYQQVPRALLELIRRTSAYLPPDVSNVIELHRMLEQKGSKADLALELVSQNIGLAKRLSAPICQDTGTITFYVKTPVGFDQLALQEVCCDAVAEATARGYLRQNSVDSISGRNTGNNLGPGSPVFHWHQHRKDDVDVRLILKGGGCENIERPVFAADHAGRQALRPRPGGRARLRPGCRLAGAGQGLRPRFFRRVHRRRPGQRL